MKPRRNAKTKNDDALLGGFLCGFLGNQCHPRKKAMASPHMSDHGSGEAGLKEDQAFMLQQGFED